jgi:hypothetical protein
MKPIAREAECDPLYDTACRQSRLMPVRPESAIPGRFVKELRDFVNVPEPHVSTEKMADEMQRGVGQTVNRFERWKSESINLPHGPSSPKLRYVSGIEPHCLRIPETEVQFDGKRHFRIVVIAAPRPTGPADHDGQMVGPRVEGIAYKAESQRVKRFRSGGHRLPGNVQVNIVLRTMARVIGVSGPLRKAFQHNILDSVH